MSTLRPFSRLSVPSLVFASVASLPLAAACGDDAEDGGGGVGSTSTSGASTTTSTKAATSSTTSTSASTADATSTTVTSTSSGAIECPPTATTVSLADVMQRAAQVTADAFGAGLTDPEIYFQEGLNAVPAPAPNDMGAIVVSFDGPEENKVFTGQRFLYRASLWGIEDVMIGRVAPYSRPGWDAQYPPGDDMFLYFAPGSATGLMVDDVPQAQLDALADDFETAFPGSTMSFYADGAIFTFIGVDPSTLGAAFAFMRDRPEVDLIEADGEVYAQDFGFGPRVNLESRVPSGLIDVYEEYAFLSKWLRLQGARTYNLPTLPVPLGPGPLARSGTGNYVIAFTPGADEDACVAGLEACGFTTLNQGGNRFLVDPSYLGASGLRHACVAGLTGQGGP